MVFTARNITLFCSKCFLKYFIIYTLSAHMLRTVLIFWDVRNDLKIAPLTPPLPFYKNFFKAIALVKATIMQMITKKSRKLTKSSQSDC